jgi:outer membrane protein
MTKRTFKCFLVVGLTALCCMMAEAQEPRPPAPLSLQDAINVALANQVDIKIGQNNVTISKGRYTEALSSYFPQVSVRNNTFRTGTRGVLGTTNTGTALTVTQDFWDGGLREAKTRGARYGVTQNRANLVRTTQSVTFSVTQDYYNVLRAKHLAEVAESNVKYNEALREIVQTRAEIGTAAKSDVLPVDAQLANAKVALVSALNDLRTAQVQLQNTMGVSPQPGFDVVDVTAAPDFQVQPMEAYIQTGAAVRPDVAASKAALGSAKAAVTSARIPLYPRPVISGDYQKGFGTDISSSHEIVGSIVFDVFNGNANRAAYREARASQSTADSLAKQVIKDIQAQVQEAYLNLTSAKERLSASDVGLAAAQSNYDVQSAKYKEGLAITLDLLNAEVQVVTAQTNQVQARYDYYTAVAQLQFAIGNEGVADANRK